MITNKILPAHILRLYVWELLRQEINMSKVNDLIPILPIEDEPKVESANLPYAIYGYAENDSKVDQIHEGVFSLRVNAPTFAQLGQITNTVALAFESSDIATEAVNRFSSQYSGGALLGIRFTFTKVTYIEGGEAAESEGGPVDGIVNVYYRYVNALPNPVVNAARGGLWS